MTRSVRVALAGTLAALACVPAAAAAAAGPAVPANQPLVVLRADHVARARPAAAAAVVETVSARRPLTGVPTILPVLGHATDAAGARWVRVRLPGRPNGHVGWIATVQTDASSTEWLLALDLSARQVTVYRDGLVARRFRAVVGKASTPTPRGRFFVEEAVALSARDAGAPFALATSARSNVLQEFDGGPGQIALHGTNNISGALGTASSHGCVRVATSAIRWLAARIGSGVPLIVRA
ncbi:L,D-transpeptidase [Paraconexibacter antarcticus]|uniref:L,D-transpeptidase n=1 Tax=Paraconexibacter antarcticus TaxID=2949664 RepID=A0ABY5DVP4_9ACTN|nr:L,D-transpeptidase [Paraconexibacter antarcticus]UTI64922.1 L,D-transpeptidase [Paraconexibacter antarcticus]